MTTNASVGSQGGERAVGSVDPDRAGEPAGTVAGALSTADVVGRQRTAGSQVTRVTGEPSPGRAPRVGDLVEVRARQWVVSDVDIDDVTLVELQSVADDRFDETLTVVWEIETDARVLPSGSLPELTGRFDRPEQLAAFLDAVSWGAVTSADTALLQAPSRSGVVVEDYQLEPVARALTAPRVNLLLADDVGLGKTIEAGLVALELLLRQRARRVMIVCPAGLTVKWRQDMAEKFGIDCVIVNAEECKKLRLTHGAAANPFEVFPFVIVSLPWLRSSRGQRLLDEVLPTDSTARRRKFDLLILDEAHHVAPAAPQQRYAVDSRQTRLIRRLVPHFEHRLFLSATPHNGYPESFTALLELIDNQRFARGVVPDEAVRREVVVRRLKSDIVDADGRRTFPPRLDVPPLEVDYSPVEREGYRLLTEFAAARAKRLGRRARSTDLVTLVLKKRLFSSPQAFANTVDVLRRSYSGARWDDDAFDDPDDFDGFDLGDPELGALSDEDQLAAEDTAVGRAGSVGACSGGTEEELLDRMAEWAADFAVRPDAKATALIDYLTGVCRPDGRHWTNERVVVFTEYRDTQEWLRTLLEQRGLGGDRLGLLHGGLSADDREELRQRFQAEPDEDRSRVRILLATDAASEGIDLHWHCHRLVNFDIPFNPNKLEQRIGRVDRYGQRFPTEIRHFVSAGWRTADDAFAGDLDFLSRVARKVARIELDLGAANAVIAGSVKDRLLGGDVDLDSRLASGSKRQRRSRVPSDTDVSARVRRLRSQLDDSVAKLHMTPRAVERVVRTALPLAHQQQITECPDDPLAPAADPAGSRAESSLFTVPPLTGPWARAAAMLPHPVHTDRVRPVTFDRRVVSERRDDVVLAHLGHPLVAMSARLLRAAVTGKGVDLARVTAVLSDDPHLGSTFLGAYARFIIVGADGVRLHEEVLHAGGWLGRGFVRERGVNRTKDILTAGLEDGVAAPPHVADRLVSAWPRVRSSVLSALEARAATRHESLVATLQQRRAEEEKRVVDNFDRFTASLRHALGEVHGDGFVQPVLDFSEVERRQVEEDRRSWQRRLAAVDTERDAELAAIAAKYADPRMHVFPVAVVAVVPRAEASR